MKRLFSQTVFHYNFKNMTPKKQSPETRKHLFHPGVITQQVSCEIELSPWKEAILDCIQYFTMAVAVAISGLLAHRYAFVRNSSPGT